MDLYPLGVTGYNAFQAALVVNAIDSERKDRDYMFHPLVKFYFLIKHSTSHSNQQDNVEQQRTAPSS